MLPYLPFARIVAVLRHSSSLVYPRSTATLKYRTCRYLSHNPFRLISTTLEVTASPNIQRFTMSAGLNMGTSVDPQLESKFFVAPAEIRRAIYVHLIPDQIHLFLHERGLRLSACVQRDEDGDPDCIKRRSNKTNLLTDPHASDPIYALRLRSSWGSHWRCEESVMRMREKDCETDCNIAAMALLPVCKRMLASDKPV